MVTKTTKEWSTALAGHHSLIGCHKQHWACHKNAQGQTQGTLGSAALKHSSCSSSCTGSNLAQLVTSGARNILQHPTQQPLEASSALRRATSCTQTENRILSRMVHMV